MIAGVQLILRAAFGDEIIVVAESIPRELAEKVPATSAVRIRSSGSLPRRGILGLQVVRVDIDAIASSWDEAHVLQDRCRIALETWKRANGVKLARREEGPYPLNDEETRWPTIWSSWIIHSSNICAPGPPANLVFDDGELELGWNRPGEDGGVAIYGGGLIYEWRWRLDNGPWSETLEEMTEKTSFNTSDHGSYTFQVRSKNILTASAWAEIEADI